MKRIVINADDFGLSVGVSQCIVHLLDAGVVSSTTVMMCADNLNEVLDSVDWNPIMGRAGVHLQLTNGRPLTPGKSLTPDGSDTRFLSRESNANYDPKDAEDEWRAQIELFERTFGVKPSHIDTHHGFHRDPRYTQTYLKLARRFDIPVRGGEEPFLSAMKSAGVLGSTLFVRKWSLKGLPLSHLTDQLRHLAKKATDSDLIEVTTHPAYVDEALRDVSSQVGSREHERRCLEELHEQDWLARHGLDLVDFTTWASSENHG